MDDAAESVLQSVRGPDEGLPRGGGGGGPAGTGPPPAGDPGGCPVTPLGHFGGEFHFLDVVGQHRTLSARQLMSLLDLLGLFGAKDGWLRQAHPKYENVQRQKGAPPIWGVVGFAHLDAALALQAACFAVGLFGEHIVLRKPGVWRDAEGGVAVHCGDMVLIGGKWRAAGWRVGHEIWAAAAATARPGPPCPAGIGGELQDGLRDLWGWDAAGGPVAVLGLIACAYYGAAIQWRPSGFVTGGTGSGKTALQKVIRAALPMHHFGNDTSKAGIEQAINGRAMPILIDEAADRANTDAARNLIDLVLSASGDEGTVGSRGTVDGRGRSIAVVGLIMMFSINPPNLEPQHLGRFAVIELKQPVEGADFTAEHGQLERFARANGPALWGRALAAWDRYQAALGLFRAGLRTYGCAPREMDQAGALLAGWWVLAREGLPDAKGVREGIGALSGYVRLAFEVAEDSRPRRMFVHLLSRMVAMHRSTDREPVGELIDVAFGGVDHRSPDDAAKLLTHYGIRVVRACVNKGLPPPPKGCQFGCCRYNGRAVPRLSDGGGLWFATQNPELARLFEATPFSDGRWRWEMLRLPGATPSRLNVRIGSVHGRAIWLPKAVFDETDTDLTQAPDTG